MVLRNNVGATILLEGEIATALLSETPGRVVVAVKREHAHEIATIAQKYDFALTKIGVTGGHSLVINDADIALDDLRSAYTDTIPRLFG
jgi:phosphoribosylformylglycinamidine (FGAM) synthase-like enzyme